MSNKITVKQVQEARKYALHCYQVFNKAVNEGETNSQSLFNMYCNAFAEYQQLDIKLFEQQIAKP